MGLFNRNNSYSDNEGVRNTAKSLRYKTDNFALYIFTTWYYHQNYRRLDPEFFNEAYSEDTWSIESLNKALVYCLYILFADRTLKVRFKIRTRRDSIENLRAYSECLKDTVKFSKEASKIIAEDNPRFKIV